jgi:hypothetical protein
MYTMRFDFENEPILSATKPMFYGWTTYMLRYKVENYIYLLYQFYYFNNSNQINIILIFHIHSFDILLSVIRNSIASNFLLLK